MSSDHHLLKLTAHKYVLCIVTIIISKPKLVKRYCSYILVCKIVSLVLTSIINLLYHPSSVRLTYYFLVFSHESLDKPVSW